MSRSVLWLATCTSMAIPLTRCCCNALTARMAPARRILTGSSMPTSPNRRVISPRCGWRVQRSLFTTAKAMVFALPLIPTLVRAKVTSFAATLRIGLCSFSIPRKSGSALPAISGFVISTDLHRPRQARLDAEGVNNFRLAQAGFVSEFGLDFIGGIAKNIGNVAVLDKMFQAFLDDKDVTSTQDAIEGVPENVKKTDWVLAAMAQLSSSKSWINGELVTMDGVDSDGNPEPMNIWRQPRLAKRAFRHLTERIMQINKLRIPVPIDAAVRAYALFDMSIMDHSDPQYDGQGFYFSNGVL